MRPSCLLLALVVVACGDDDGSSTTPDGAAPADAAPSDGGDLISARPYDLRVPAGLSPGTPAPLVVLLHGYTATGAGQEAYFQLGSLVDGEGFLYAIPEGTTDSFQSQFWNATDACCDLGDTQVDDVVYLTAVVDDVAARYTVDPKRIYFVGHSNGGFMAHRMACDRSTRVAAIVSLAGATWSDPTRCDAAEPVSVLQIHGAADQVILYDGGMIGSVSYPGARTTVGTWATKNGCTGSLAQSGASLDLDSALLGAETRVEETGGCPAAGTAALWTIEGGSHIPAVAHPAWETSIWGFLEAHPKP